MKTYKGFNNTGDPLEATQYKGKTWIVFFLILVVAGRQT